ncbi:hypothetical protein [Flavobacterium acetivorans]|uniref:hypothetical protein n=1 Tax=Flavobacterium acetivorans TaxID=2893883 RepID=UPI001E647126|nr:hypothetical protein [Flavobacterium sp. F-29]UFH36060.1 hypothetical protein LNP19_03225 [Flavobacterium sp. F-29]
MANLQDYFANLRIEKFDSFKFNNNLSSLNISQNAIIFFDLENNPEINKYIKNQHSELNKKFAEVDKNFIYLSNLDYPKDIRGLLKFYLPYLSASDLKQFYSEKHIALTFTNQITELFNEKPDVSSFLSEYQSILDYIGYKGNIKCGLLFFDSDTTTILDCNDFAIKGNTELFFNDLTTFFKNAKGKIEESDCMIGNTQGHDPYENLDEDAKEKIRDIQIQLRELKNSGQLLFALPILKDILNNEVNKINLDSTNTIAISNDYRIVLPHFDNLEIQLSHLTKAVYILFYNNPYGINIKELYKYKKELENLYSKISNQLDYDKMMQSIEDLVKPESKAIYTHISRIKSAFYKQMDLVYAKNFIVAGGTFGDDFKYISIIRPKIVYDPEFDD